MAKKIFLCRTCGEEFDNRSDLGKHIQHHLKEPEFKDGFYIPRFLTDEFKGVPDKTPLKGTWMGVMTDRGVEVMNLKVD